MIILLSGPIAVGKTSVAAALTQAGAARLVTVRSALLEVLGLASAGRALMQREGAALDQRTSGRWLLHYLEQRTDLTNDDFVVDSLRTVRQTEPLLGYFADARLVYLTAHEETRRARYAAAAATDPLKRAVPFDAAMQHRTEIEVVALGALAHASIATDDLEVEELANEIIARLT
ncbi:AAA family ATPase [Nocardioides sp. BP30]|uniref:AAA family ATPase n=1 Tax=Nocardioides sp. BP30 TaxID=3036374 RepID=UPI00246899A6|nr:AAA family ATPase [Nocardioides sp. BP30]WGL52584.1 AAA family ATPase [Nocardioides sp. BP30]